MSIKKQLLAKKNECKVTFSLPAEAAPNAKEVKVVGDFNNWDWNDGLKLKKTAKEFKGSVKLPAGKQYQFRYLIDNSIWENDWNADAYVQSPFSGEENSLVILPSGELASVRKAPKATKTTKTARTTKSKVAKKKDFTVIEGIGPKINTILSENGFESFDQLAKAKVAELRKVLAGAGKRYAMHDPSTWAKQSKLAAAEKWDELKELQKTLKGGRK